MLCPDPDAHADYFARETRQATLLVVSQVTLPNKRAGQILADTLAGGHRFPCGHL